MNYFIWFLLILTTAFPLWPESVRAKENVVKQDTKQISKLEVDSNGDGAYDIMTWYKNVRPFYQEKDTGFDGKKDFFCYFDTEGYPEKIEEDTKYTGRIDIIRIYRKGIPVKIEYDAYGDGFMETISFYKEEKMYLQTLDENKDQKFTNS